jgi:uncharacterized membrane protein
MNAVLPNSIKTYLEAVRQALGDADPALVQDALYDAEEYLRSEMAENPGVSEAEIVSRVAQSYGAPDEVADIYRETETRVSRAMRPPRPAPRRSWIGRFFGVAADARTYGALFYMLFSLATGIFYFTWAVTGVSLSLGLAILIIGVPFAVLFLSTVRVLSLVEGRIVETLLGVRMPRRPLYANRGKPMLKRIAEMFSDPRTWSTLLYQILMLPLGIAYFTIAVTGLAVSAAFIATPFAYLFADSSHIRISDDDFVISWFFYLPPWLGLPLLFITGVVLLFSMLHLARGVGHVHGHIAKHLLVKLAQHG